MFSELSAEDVTPSGIDTKQSLRVLLPHKNKPLSYIHEGKPSGIYVEMLELVATHQGLEMDIQLVSFARANQLMLNASADISIAHSGLKMQRPEAIYLPFTKDLKISLFSLQDNEIEIHQKSDIWQYKIGTQRVLPDLQIQGMQVQYFKAPSHLVRALKAGRVELIVLADAGVPYFNKLYDVDLTRVHHILSNTISFWFNRASLDERAMGYCQRFVQGITELVLAGKISRLATQYNFPVATKLFRDGSVASPFECIESL